MTEDARDFAPDPVRNLSREKQDDLRSGGSTVRSLGMAYDWRPTASRAATTDPAVVALPRRQPAVAAAPDVRRADDILVSEAVEEFIAAAEGGWARNRSGRRYKPSALRDIRGILRHHVVPELGGTPLRDVRPRHIQALLDRLAAEELSESRIRSVVSAVRALYGYAIDQGQVELSAADGLQIPQQAAPASTDAGSTWEWTDPVQDAPRQKPAARRDEYEPITLLPERILSLVLRIVVVLFVLFALVTIAGSIGGA
jgi:Phage integrase, N-terminal SAM-like domain